MNRIILLIAGVSALGLYFAVVPLVTRTYQRYRGRKTIVCPETGRIVEVQIKAGRASLMSIFGTTAARVKRCSLWPRKKGCAEECVKEYWESAPEVENYRADKRKPS
jgi:hypothetical protein